jgi:hypothetical protein
MKTTMVETEHFTVSSERELISLANSLIQNRLFDFDIHEKHILFQNYTNFKQFAPRIKDFTFAVRKHRTIDPRDILPIGPDLTLVTVTQNSNNELLLLLQ